MRTRGILREAGRLYVRHWFRLVAVTSFFTAGIAILTTVLTYALGGVGVFIAAPFWLGGIFWVQGAVAKAVEDVRDGTADLTIRETVRQGAWARVNALGAAGLLALLGIYAGLLLLVVPGLFLLARWSLIAPTIVLENAGTFGSFGRSYELVRGSSWRVAWLVLVSAVLVLGGWFALGASFESQEELLPGGDIGAAVAFAAESVVLFTLVVPFVAVAWTLVYYRVHETSAPRPGAEWRFRVGDVLDRAWDLYRTHPARLIILAAAVFFPLAGLEYAAASLGDALAIAAPVATLFGLLILPGLLAAGLEADFERASARRWFRELGARVKPKVAAIVGVSLVVTIAVTAGLAIFLIAGLVVLTFWSLATPAIVLDDRGVRASLSRSRELVSGNGPRVFAVIVLSAVIALLLFVIVSPYVPFVPLPGLILGFLVASVAESVMAPFIALSWIVMYDELRRIRDAWAAQTAPATEPAPLH